MKVLGIILLTMSLTGSAFAKDPNPHVSTANGAAGDPSFYSQNIQPVLEALQTGKVVIQDPNCINPSYTNYSNVITATVNYQNFYVLLSPGMINGRNFFESYCQSTKQGNSVQIDCSAKEQNPVNPPGMTLSFYMAYTTAYDNSGVYTVSVCPRSAQ